MQCSHRRIVQYKTAYYSFYLSVSSILDPTHFLFCTIGSWLLFLKYKIVYFIKFSLEPKICKLEGPLESFALLVYVNCETIENGQPVNNLFVITSVRMHMFDSLTTPRWEPLYWHWGDIMLSIHRKILSTATLFVNFLFLKSRRFLLNV